MKNIVVAAALCISLGASWPAQAGECERYPLEMVSNQEGLTYAVYLSDTQLERTPAWRPAAGEPPLSVSEVYRLATEWAADRYAKYDSVEIAEIALKPIGCYAYRDRWYFKVEFRPIIDGNKLFGMGNYAVVLFDGTVVGPKKSQRAPYPRDEPPPTFLHPPAGANPI